MAILANGLSLLAICAIGFGVGILLDKNTIRTYGDHCNSDSECDLNSKLLCQSGVCNCSSLYYFKTSSKMCISKESYSAICTNSVECCCGQVCTKNVCSCENDRWWDSSANTCRKLKYSQKSIKF